MCTTEQTPSQTELTAHLLINALTPAQRAILFTALTYLETDTAVSLADLHNPNNKMVPVLANRVKAFHQWGIKEIKIIKNNLFADCFIDDLELSQHFTISFPMPKTNKG